MTFRKTTALVPAIALALTPAIALSQSDSSSEMSSDQPAMEQSSDTAQNDMMSDDGGSDGESMTAESDSMSDSESGDMTTAQNDSSSSDGAGSVAGYDEETLSSFVDAAMNVASLRQTYAVRMQSAESEEQRQTIAQEATEEMRTAVEDTDGISIDEYIEIGEASSENEELNQAITAMVQERMPQQQGGGQQGEQNEG